MSGKEKLVLGGNGMAGVRTLEELLALAPNAYDITVFGAEPYGNYNRILLSPVLAGEKTVQDIMLNDEQWYIKNNITLYKGKRIADVQRGRRAVVAADGTVVAYDRLLLATGSNPFIIPVPGHHLAGVVSFRDIHDVNAMLEASGRYRRVVVIGGGLLGLEAANGLLKQGMYVDVEILPAKSDQAIVVPAGAVLRDADNLPFVYLQVKPGTFARRHVKLAAQLGDTYAIEQGLDDGAEVLTNGALFVQFADSLEQ